MTQTETDVNPASKRHWMYGMNATLLVAIGLVIWGLLLYLCNTTSSSAWAHFDWTGTGVNSLSGSTKEKVLQSLKGTTDKYQILSLFPTASDEERRLDTANQQTERRQQILDLLREYARLSPQITTEDDGDAAREEVEKRIRDLYATELKPYQEAVQQFDPLAKRIADFLKDEGDVLGVEAQKPGMSPEDARALASLQAQFKSAPAILDELTRSLRRDANAVLPPWSSLIDRIKTSLDSVEAMFTLLSDPAKVKVALTPSLSAYFVGAAPKYKAIATELTAYMDKLAKLPPLKVQDVLAGFGRNTVVILGPGAAKVITADKLFQASPSPSGGNQSSVSFTGEQAISSALFAMIHPDKVKVVFVTTSPQQLLVGNFSGISQVLQDENFDVLEWSPPGSPTPGGPPQGDPTPPAEGRGVVWVVFPPEPDMQMMQMGMSMPPNPQPVIDAVKRHMAEGGQVMFMAEASMANPFMGGAGVYPYADLVRDFGVDVQAKYTVVHLLEGNDPDTGEHIRRISPYIQVDHFEDHQITRPLQSLTAVFGPARTQTGMPSFVTAVSVPTPVPAGIDATVLVKTPGSSDFWGETQYANDAKFDLGVDLPAPVPLAVAAVKNKGQKDKDGKSLEQRVIVIGSKQFAMNFFLDMARPVLVGSRLVAISELPGNSELMRNSILWLAGYENMIAVSAKANQVSRIDASPNALIFMRIGVLGLLPIAALALGGIMWMVRRR